MIDGQQSKHNQEGCSQTLEMLEKKIREVGQVRQGIPNCQNILFAVYPGEHTAQRDRQIHRADICRQANRDDKIHTALQKNGNTENGDQLVNDMHQAIFP